MSEGFFLLHRGWRDNSIFKGEFSRSDAWVWLIENTCWKPTRHDVKGKTVTLERGQICASRERLSKVFQWSPSAVERFLVRLETEQMIERETGQGKTIITVCNYAKYQDVQSGTGQETEQQTGQESDRNRTAKEQGNKGTSIGEEAKASPPPRVPAARKLAMTPDWVPSPLPKTAAELVAQWPPGRLDRELEEFRAYWIESGTKRPGWDRSWHSRINDIHDKVLRDSRNGQPRQQQHLAPSGRTMGRTEAAAREVALRLAGTTSANRGGGERLSLPLPDPVRPDWDDGGRPRGVVGSRA